MARTNHALYNTWALLRHRCQNPKSSAYRYYGGIGVSMCQSWQNFQRFAEDVGERPSPRHVLERIDKFGNYDKTNCRWALNPERSTKSMTEFEGVRASVCEWARRLGIDEMTLRSRLERAGVEEAFCKPVKRRSVGVSPNMYTLEYEGPFKGGTIKKRSAGTADLRLALAEWRVYRAKLPPKARLTLYRTRDGADTLVLQTQTPSS